MAREKYPFSFLVQVSFSSIFLSIFSFYFFPHLHKYLHNNQVEQWWTICPPMKEMGLNPWVGKISWSRKWQLTPYYCLKNSMDRRVWWATVHGTEQLTGWLILSIRQNTVFGFVGFVFNYWTNGNPLQYPRLENPMDGGAWWAAVHGVTRVGHDWATSLSLFTFMLWRRKQQPTPVFLPGESQGRGSLVGCHLWGRTESGMTEVT